MVIALVLFESKKDKIYRVKFDNIQEKAKFLLLMK